MSTPANSTFDLPAAVSANVGTRLKTWVVDRFELSRGGGAHNVRPMEGLRGFAVFLVFLVHFTVLSEPRIASGGATELLAAAAMLIGNVGVDLFFVLSGYLIYGSLMARPQAFGPYMLRRLQRIYPAFLAVFVLYVVLSFLYPAESKLPEGTGATLVYLLQNLLLLPGLFPIEALIVQAWTLSYEMFYYLAIPLVIGAFGLRERSPGLRVAFFAVVAVLLLAGCGWANGPVRLAMFVAGILLHEAMRSASVRSPGSALGTLALAIGLAATLVPRTWFPTHSIGEAVEVSILFVAFFVVCLACFRSPGAALPAAFSWTPLRWLGNMSYSYYLLHGLALKAGFLVVGKLIPAGPHDAWLVWLLLPTMFVWTLLPSAALFVAIERPLSLVTKRRKGGPRSA